MLTTPLQDSSILFACKLAKWQKETFRVHPSLALFLQVRTGTSLQKIMSYFRLLHCSPNYCKRLSSSLNSIAKLLGMEAYNVTLCCPTIKSINLTLISSWSFMPYLNYTQVNKVREIFAHPSKKDYCVESIKLLYSLQHFKLYSKYTRSKSSHS